jgi:CspA family cold shock protein
MSKTQLLRIILISITVALPFALIALLAFYTGQGQNISAAWASLQGSENFGILFTKMYGVVFLALLSGGLLQGVWSGTVHRGVTASEAAPAMGREHGEVKWFNGKKGYGFIVRDNGEEVFVHYREIQGQGRRVLFEGQKVEFRVGEGQKGPEAQEVTPL